MKHFYLTKRRCLKVVAFILLICNTGCRPAERLLPDLQLSADAIENSYLISILFSHNMDSIGNCAVSDYRGNKYYIFLSATPADVKFNNYLAAYARQKYRLILVNCGGKGRVGACYYNNKMAALLAERKLKPFGSIYLEAKVLYNKKLPVYLNMMKLSAAAQVVLQ